VVNFREWINMSGALQATFMNQRSFEPPTPTVIGQAFGGGFFAGQIGTSSVASHYLIVAPLSSGQTALQWKTSNSSTSGTSSDIDGPANTASQVAAGSHPCATFCNNAVIGGFSDWYMAAKNELEICYFNLKPSTASNQTSSGINPNAVPARASNYTNTPKVPAQTSAAAFQDGGAEAFSPAGQDYWSSTEASANYAWNQKFGSGGQYSANNTKTTVAKVRAVRRVAV
jgi:hypothetical protein